ncbi:MAG: zf-HC2 domain-containing protein, partial [Gemmatimonadaceae bacterium]|nr:zf-HC2 domain-containing protein [Gemmatimonadaceae bacterium]
MADCSNVDIRELLPERAGGALSAADLARVEAHLAECGMCAGELALIQAVRASLRVAPRIDVVRIAGAVRSATAAPTRPMLVDDGARAPRRLPRARWIGWKTAAAVAIAAAGGGTMLLSRHVDDASVAPAQVATAPAPSSEGGANAASAANPTAATASAPVAA